MCIKMMYNITTFKNVFKYQMTKFNNAKLQLLLRQLNVLVRSKQFTVLVNSCISLLTFLFICSIHY